MNHATEAMHAAMDESTTSNSYQVSSSAPEQVQTSSRGMHVRKSNSKSSGSNSRSSSSSSGRPPLPKGATSQRGPGSLALPVASPIDSTPVGSRPGTPEPVVVEETIPKGFSAGSKVIASINCKYQCVV